MKEISPELQLLQNQVIHCVSLKLVSTPLTREIAYLENIKPYISQEEITKRSVAINIPIAFSDYLNGDISFRVLEMKIKALREVHALVRDCHEEINAIESLAKLIKNPRQRLEALSPYFHQSDEGRALPKFGPGKSEGDLDVITEIIQTIIDDLKSGILSAAGCSR